MRQPLETEVGIFKRAVQALETTTGLRVQVRNEPQEEGQTDTLIDIVIDDRVIRFAAEIKAVDRFQTLGTIKARAALTPYPLLLIAPYITETTAARCRDLHLPFIDEAGNAYLEATGLFVYVTGKRRPLQVKSASAYRALTPAGLRIVFALLNCPGLAAVPYREIAKEAKVALGSVGEVLADLEGRGHLASERPGSRRLLAPERLQEEWVTHYPIKLRPKLNPRRFTAPAPDWWRGQDARQYHAYWGGEIAAEKLTGYLKPARVTLYVGGRPDRLILANRLRPDVNGEIEILEAFWSTDEKYGGLDVSYPENVAPPLVVYADLLVTTDPRNIETAKLIRDRYLTQVLPPV